MFPPWFWDPDVGPRRAQGPSLSSWQTVLSIVSSSLGSKDTPHLWNRGEIGQNVNSRHENIPEEGLGTGSSRGPSCDREG